MTRCLGSAALTSPLTFDPPRLVSLPQPLHLPPVLVADPRELLSVIGSLSLQVNLLLLLLPHPPLKHPPLHFLLHEHVDSLLLLELPQAELLKVKVVELLLPFLAVELLSLAELRLALPELLLDALERLSEQRSSWVWLSSRFCCLECYV